MFIKELKLSKTSYYLLMVNILALKATIISFLALGVSEYSSFSGFFLHWCLTSIFLSFVMLPVYIIKNQKWIPKYVFIIDLLFTIFLYSNMIYFREFGSYLTLSIILSASSNASVQAMSSIVPLFSIFDLLLILFLVVHGLWSFKQTITFVKERFFVYKVFVPVFTGLFFFINMNIFTMMFASSRNIKNNLDKPSILLTSGIFGYNVYDYLRNSEFKELRVHAEQIDLTETEAFLKDKNTSNTENPYYGIAKDKNIIYIHLESFQQFLIDYRIPEAYGSLEVTPYLNSLVNNQDTYSFNNFYHQVGIGKTSDAETMIETGRYGIDENSFMSLYGGRNRLEAMPEILKDDDYESYVFHGNQGTFWNRIATYKNMGYDDFIEKEDFKETEIEGFGILDESFFKESLDYLKARKDSKFYTKLISVTHHLPFGIENLNHDFPKVKELGKDYEGFFATANYLDKQVQAFMEGLEQEGMLDDSLVIFYGDHFGINSYDTKVIEAVLNKKEITKADLIEFQKVPLIYYMKDSNFGGVKDETLGGQIDIMPTLLDLIGKDNTDKILFGQSLFSSNRNGVTPFRNGNYVSKDYFYTENTYYDWENNVLEASDKMKKESRLSEELLKQSDYVSHKDLLRFKKE